MPPRTLAALLGIWSPLTVLAAWAIPLASDRVHIAGFADYFRNYVPWLEAGLGLFAAGLLASAVAALRGKRVAAIATASAVNLTAATLGLMGSQTLSALYSTEQSYHQIVADLAEAQPGTPFYSVRMFDHSLLFKLRRPVILVEYRDELDLGLRADPQKGIATIAEFRKRWRDADDAFAIMRPDTYAALAREGLPMYLLSKDPRHVLVRRRPPAKLKQR